MRGDVRSDIYGWGVLMYEILTGRVPFSGDNWMATMAAHLQQHPKPIRQLRPEVPAALEAVVLKAMRRYPGAPLPERHASCVDDLDHLDTLDLTTFDLSPEEPMGGIAAMDSTKRHLGHRGAGQRSSFIGIIAVIITLAYVA